ncbi:FKBP-type peptidyl-prolyl cis-trans isomerase [Homoserinibacter sp. GY 40078]|uniref:FKBP-type peptidyl-prolyl cis-trans isomerase n=1 Tax=Homoserinibacter sp. GY 40078 TaxID=2603275 RepID=UPI0016508641|nr:FKBP-type peptidyl-prolyl cis-trans isomerase [Homoserinibacter sp. GY 40078]
MRRILPVLTVAALAVTLAGCAGTAEPDATSTANADECAVSGSSSEAVTASSDFGTLPTVSFDAPLEPEVTERTLVTQGDGDPAPHGAVATIDYSFYNGRSGEVIESTDYTDGQQAVFVLGDQLLAGLRKTIECTPVGSRVIGVAPAADAFGDEGLSDYGIEAGDPLVFVVDLLAAETRAWGEPQDAPDGFPTVELDDDGRPTVTMPDGFETPKTSESAVLIQGDGRAVEETDQVYIQYQGLDAATGEIFDETWDDGNPYSGSASGFITGFTDALVGQKVGSQFIVVIPPAEGYGEASDDNTNELAGKTLVFVVDLLGAVPTV